MLDTFNPLSGIALGAEVRGEKMTYRIEKWLGTGSTGVVYLAVEQTSQQAVALKVLRPDATAEGTINFWEEGFTLGLLRQKLENNSVIPRKYDQHKSSFPQFLALELVSKETYPSLEDLLEQRVLPEGEGLTLAIQALEVLQALHTQLFRTYTDMQFKNFCWNSVEQRLKIMDWGHLSDDYTQDPQHQKFAALRQQDLARFATYLYRMVTRKAAREAGETASALQKRAGEHWETLSLGTRQLLIQALHPNPEVRFASAEAFLAAVRERKALLDEWTEEQKESYRTEFRDILKQVEEEWKSDPNTRPLTAGKWQRLDRASRLFAAFKARDEYDDASARRFEDRLQKILQGETGEWARGQRLYQAGRYAEALTIWEPEANARGEVRLWRWVHLAKAGVNGGEHSAQINELLQAMQVENWMLAQTLLERLYPANGESVPEALRPIAAEVQARRAAQIALSATHPEEKLTSLERIVQQRSVIPHWPLLAEERGWLNLDQQIEQLKLQIQAQHKSSTEIEMLRDSLLTGAGGEVHLQSQLLASLETAFESASPSTVAALVQMCLEVVAACLNSKEASEAKLWWALAVVEKAFHYGPSHEENLPKAIHLIKQRLTRRQQAAWIEKSLAELETAKDTNDLLGFCSVVLPEGIQSQARYQRLQEHFRKQFDENLQMSYLPDAHRILPWLERLGPEPDRRARLSEAQWVAEARVQVLTLFAEATRALERLKEDDWQNAKQTLKYAEASLSRLPANDPATETFKVLSCIAQELGAGYLLKLTKVEARLSEIEDKISSPQLSPSAVWREIEALETEFVSGLLKPAREWQHQITDLRFESLKVLQSRLNNVLQARTLVQQTYQVETAPLLTALESVKTQIDHLPQINNGLETLKLQSDKYLSALFKRTSQLALLLVLLTVLSVLALGSWQSAQSQELVGELHALATSLVSATLDQATPEDTQVAVAAPPTETPAIPPTETVDKKEVAAMTQAAGVTQTKAASGTLTALAPTAAPPLLVNLSFTPTVWSLPKEIFYDLPPIQIDLAAPSVKLTSPDKKILQIDSETEPEALQLALLNSQDQYWDGIKGEFISTSEPITLTGNFEPQKNGSFVWTPATWTPELQEKRVPAGNYTLRIFAISGNLASLDREIKIDSVPDDQKAVVINGQILHVSNNIPVGDPQNYTLAGFDKAESKKFLFFVIGKTNNAAYLRIMREDRRQIYWVKPGNVYRSSNPEILFDYKNVIVVP